jgi:hypothetical protein
MLVTVYDMEGGMGLSLRCCRIRGILYSTEFSRMKPTGNFVCGSAAGSAAIVASRSTKKDASVNLATPKFDD